MTPDTKISSAFEPFLAASGPTDKRDAIVVYKTALPKEPPLRGRLRLLKQRLDYIKQRSKLQTHAQQQLAQDYHKAGSKELAVTPIGESILPIAKVEVTRKSLAALAAQPDVVAILPNQPVHLIQPAAINPAQLSSTEDKDGLTWGLKQLQIPTLWKTTKGEQINVAVLDTGVFGDHPALQGKVKSFVVIDSLRRRITTSATFDGDGHGTHVCGTIAGGKTAAGLSIGVAPESRLLVGAVLIGRPRLENLKRRQAIY